MLPGDAKADYLRVPVIGFALLATAAFNKAFRHAGTPAQKEAHVRHGD
ncbi:MAG TPA: hypothetical protein PLB01_14525 [Thermoanaerobaculia bacterium]|nr:hypothetical protein [Thermoanaerobaculia bacterium]